MQRYAHIPIADKRILYIDYKCFIYPQLRGSFQDARPFELIAFDLKYLSFDCVRKIETIEYIVQEMFEEKQQNGHPNE